ncbi:hypothetical protein GCM10023321_40050 [Pseudonocardia eucalypti]|uniref:Uncharacterized protein n=1 Tax=Pseudonocardia eucalypti TaxID=648755 RepID=A0ABP9QA55_9PSEU
MKLSLAVAVFDPFSQISVTVRPPIGAFWSTRPVVPEKFTSDEVSDRTRPFSQRASAVTVSPCRTCFGETDRLAFGSGMAISAAALLLVVVVVVGAVVVVGRSIGLGEGCGCGVSLGVVGRGVSRVVVGSCAGRSCRVVLGGVGVSVSCSC